MALLSLSACFSPRPVVRVEPIEEPQRWNYGQAILEAEKNGITANAAFAYSDDDFLVFDVEVTNWREERILVDPAGIQLDVNSATSMYIPAIDPEEQMLGMEMDASRREANAKNAAVVAGVVAVAAVAAAVATSSNDNNNNENNFNNDGVDVVNVAPTLVLGAGAGGAPPPGPIAVDPWFWSDQTLRKTTLEKGQQVRGKVLFPRNDQIRNFEMSVPVEELIFTFEFRQVLHRP
ncbi:hypothetical protein CRP01_26955 [Flavilitoribacter nigricans DSM 23189 = NBRC 102662]|uniref:DUF4352 domain-containing protein n=1 Tax=Flavilitoribacter nigricans (strain ATCC 23147 / DSM 23189 / NBRC 102662 / NCIMB 1420 / SS-2) TaxID=1122177 RepID=A0A2D0N4L8_FLAN2|nr:hypothetical protein CRP01_26955 [Flavilitoribacter nigricans DSM 23189 = NBRC 102662]